MASLQIVRSVIAKRHGKSVDGVMRDYHDAKGGRPSYITESEDAQWWAKAHRGKGSQWESDFGLTAEEVEKYKPTTVLLPKRRRERDKANKDADMKAIAAEIIAKRNNGRAK